MLSADIAGVRIVNVYIPNGQMVGSEKYQFKLEWMKRLREFLDRVIAAVLRCCFAAISTSRRKSVMCTTRAFGRTAYSFSEPEKAALQHVKDWGFTDTFRLHTEEGGHYSWWDYRAGGFRRNLGLRIDHVWVSAPLAARSKTTVDRQRGRAAGSDLPIMRRSWRSLIESE